MAEVEMELMDTGISAVVTSELNWPSRGIETSTQRILQQERNNQNEVHVNGEVERVISDYEDGIESDSSEIITTETKPLLLIPLPEHEIYEEYGAETRNELAEFGSSSSLDQENTQIQRRPTESEEIGGFEATDDRSNPKPTEDENDHDGYNERKKKSRRGGGTLKRGRKRKTPVLPRNKKIGKKVAPANTRRTAYRLQPPPIQPVCGKSPRLVIKPLRIPETILEKSKSFVIKEEGNSRIQLRPKRQNTVSPNYLRQEKRQKTSSSKKPRYNSVASSIESGTEPETTDVLQTPSINLRHCANCNVKFSKATPKISHFRLSGERLSATDAFKKIFQLQLQKQESLVNIDMNENAGLCSKCGQLVAKIYGTIYDFTQKRTPESYFHRVSVDTLKNSCPNGVTNNTKPSGKRKNAQVATETPLTHDKSTNYPVEDPLPYRPHVPVMPVKLEDYSRVTALCDICGRGLTKESGLKTHLLLSHSISNEEKSRDFVCTVCGKAYFFQYLLKNHMAVHSDDKPFGCPKENCNATFKSRASLRTHRIEVHELREQGHSFDCKFCDKKYLRPRDLRDHTLSRHYSEPQFECLKCHRFFQRKKNVKTHNCPNRAPPTDKSEFHKPDESSPKSKNAQSLDAPVISQKNPSPIKMDKPSPPMNVEELETIQEEYQLISEPIQHIHSSLVRPTQPQQLHQSVPIISHHQQLASPNVIPFQRPQHLVSPTAQYEVHVPQPLTFSEHPQQIFQSQSQQQQQIHQYRIHSLGPLHGEPITVYETVNFLDILNEARQQQASNVNATTDATYYQNITFTK